MAFSNAVSSQTRGGNYKIVWGTYTGTAVATGELDVGLEQIHFLKLQPNKATVITTENSVDETLPVTPARTGTSKTTIDFSSGEVGYWLAIGKG